jgi:hypothetical protein
MAITALPTPPSRQDPTNFNDRADAFLGALPLFQTEANALQADVNAKQVSAAASEVSAAASATAANNTANVSIWVSGTTYAIGVNRFSPLNFLTYRRKTAGAGTTDPSLDATNWQLLTGSTSQLFTASWKVEEVSGELLFKDSADNVKLSLNLTTGANLAGTGAFGVPVGTEAQRPTGAAGKIRFNSTVNKYEGHNGTAWSSIGGGATGGGSDSIFIENGQTVTTDYTISTGKNAMSTGPVSINSGITVTIPTDSVWVVI